MTRLEIQEKFNISKATFFRWLKQGKIKLVKKVDKADYIVL